VTGIECRKVSGGCRLALGLHYGASVAATAFTQERREGRRNDRRKNPRNGRRATDPRFNWRRVAWLFASYAVVVSFRTLPSTVRRLFQRSKIAG
jgi:hypothetical protein